MLHYSHSLQLVAVLTAWTRAARCGPFQIALANVERIFWRLWKDCYGNRGSVDAAITLGRWHTLKSVTARFISERLSSALA